MPAPTHLQNHKIILQLIKNTYKCVQPQNKDSPPNGRLDKHFKEGVLFITYSLLTAKGKVRAVDRV